MTNQWCWLLFLGLLELGQPVVATAQNSDSTTSSFRAWVTFGSGAMRPLSEPPDLYSGGTISLNFGRRLIHQVRVFNGAGNVNSVTVYGRGNLLGWKADQGLLHVGPGVGSESEFRSASVDSSEYDRIRGVSYAVGIGSRSRWHLLALFAGVGVVSLEYDSGNSDEIRRSTTVYGLAVNAQAVFHLFPGIGFGIDMYANLNLHANVGAVYAVLVMGNYRRRHRGR